MTLTEKTNAISNLIAKSKLVRGYSDIAETGEIPYQANLRAMRALDIKGDREDGKAEAELMLTGLEHLITELETFRNASKQLKKKSTTVVRQS